MNRLGLLILLASVSAPLSAGDDEALIARLEQRMALDEQVSGSFQQDKHIDVLPQPLKSHGEFSYDHQNGLVWETLEPIANRLEFDQQGIRQSVDGRTVWEVDSQQPAVVTITQVISSVLASDWRTLQEYFRLEGDVADEGWQLQLKPSDEALEQVVESISVSGDRVISKMVLLEANGDRTEITFSVHEPAE